MKWIASLAMIGAMIIVQANGAEADAARFYVQLVRGGQVNELLPPGARLVGPKLKEKLGSAFRNRDYWETKREEVTVTRARPARVTLNSQRSVQIEISGDRRTVTAYYKGRAIERRSGPRGDGMTLIGDNHGGSLWFVVVRRDRPGE